MSLSAETIGRIEQYSLHEAGYTPNPQVQRQIGAKTLMMVVAPAVMGKTSIMDRLEKIDPEYATVTTLSTRTPRNDESDRHFRFRPHTDRSIDSLLKKIVSGSLVQYKFHPTEYTFYGSEAQDYPARHNMLATLSGAINQLQNVGFESTSVVGVVSPPSEWQKRFDARYPERHPARLSRVKEAEISYNDLLMRDDVRWVINYEGYLDEAAHAVIDPEKYPQNQSDALTYAHRILHRVHDFRVSLESQKYE